MPSHTVQVACPAWIDEVVVWGRHYESDEEKARLAVSLARENVIRGTGGPFGAAVFEAETGALVAVGTNVVVPSNNSSLHAEIVAYMMAQTRLGSFTLAGEGLARHVAATSCEPCAMCLGATLWSGVRRLICSASKEDAARVGFDEGPVFPESYAYLAERGIEVVRGVCRDEGREVLDLYASRGGLVYNG